MSSKMPDDMPTSISAATTGCGEPATTKHYTTAEIAEGRWRSRDGLFAPEYDQRHGHRQRAPRAQFSFTRLRINEIERLIDHRHGVIPATDDADRYVWIVVQHMRELDASDLHGDLARWCARWAPEMPADEVEAIARRALRKAYRFTADELAIKLCVTDKERAALGLTTIGAIDRRKPQRELDRAQRKRERDKAKAERRRRKAGAVPRDEFEAKSLAQIKPWLADGVSKRTWERRRKRELDDLPENWRELRFQKKAA